MVNVEILQSSLKELNTEIAIIPFSPIDLVFEECVNLKCFYCSRFDTKWTCPPRIPQLNYKAIVREYQNAAFLLYELSVDDESFNDVRTKSSNELHRALLYLEKVLWDMGNPMTLSFIGGSCKLCKNGCSNEKCMNPGLKRIPIEATGINVIKSIAKKDVIISFKIPNIIRRLGLILW